MGKQSILSKHTEISSSRLPLVFLQQAMQAFHIATAGEHRLEGTSHTGEGPFAVKISFSPGATRCASACVSGGVQVWRSYPGLKPASLVFLTTHRQAV